LKIKELKELKIGFEMDPRFGKVYTEHIATAKWNLEQESDPDDPYRDTALME
jgi:hypothetical protein